MRFWVFIKEELQKMFEEHKSSDSSEHQGGEDQSEDQQQNGLPQGGEEQSREQQQSGEPQDEEVKNDDQQTGKPQDGEREPGEQQENAEHQGGEDQSEDQQQNGLPQDGERKPGDPQSLEQGQSPIGEVQDKSNLSSNGMQGTLPSEMSQGQMPSETIKGIPQGENIPSPIPLPSMLPQGSTSDDLSTNSQGQNDGHEEQSIKPVDDIKSEDMRLKIPPEEDLKPSIPKEEPNDQTKKEEELPKDAEDASKGKDTLTDKGKEQKKLEGESQDGENPPDKNTNEEIKEGLDKSVSSDTDKQSKEEHQDGIQELPEGEIPKSKKEQIRELKELKEEIETHRDEIEHQGVHQHDKGILTGDTKAFEETPEEQYQLGDQANKFLEQLGELPNFKNRSRGPGYSIDTRGYTQVPDSVIRTLITKFLNQRFCKRDTDLNVRSNSLDEARGFYKWKVKDVIIHLETEQVTKVLNDKFGYQYANGKNENVPLSFYFDLSGSMSKYTNLLAVIAIELLKKGVKVLVGFNERVNVQIDKIDEHMTVADFAKVLSTAGYSTWQRGDHKNQLRKNHKVSMKFIDRNIDNYLIEKKAEKCVAFSDFDAINELSNLSQVAQVYYFCFESDFSKADLGDFKGFIYQVENINDIESGLVKVNSNRFETLCYTLKNKRLEKKLGE